MELVATTSAPGLDDDRLYALIVARDRRFEGRFVVAVTSTGVYCRPGCPAPTPRRKNVRFFATPPGAESAGFRPCLRCRPDAQPGSPAWLGTSATVQRALRLLDCGHDGNLPHLAARLGIGERHLRRLFQAQLGASPREVARTRRAHFARKLLEETRLPMTEVAHAAGYQSLRRFNEEVRALFRKPPRELRRFRRGAPDGGAALVLRLPVRAPYDWAQVAAHFAGRAVAGVERVDDAGYRRVIDLRAEGGGVGLIAITPSPDGGALLLEVRARPLGDLCALTARVQRQFDTRSDPRAVAERLSLDEVLRARVAARPGLRVPAAWDPFEQIVRAIVGQQISVAGARTILGRIAQRLGTPVPTGVEGLAHAFPGPQAIARGELSGLGLTGARIDTLQRVAQAIVDGALVLDDAVQLVEGLRALRGIGAWTTAYVALRLGDPDAFPAGDLGLKRAFAVGESLPREAELEARAEMFRPFRAYAAQHLWTPLLEEDA